MSDPNHGYILGPDGIRLEFSGDPSLQVPVKINHVHLYPQDIPAMTGLVRESPGRRSREVRSRRERPMESIASKSPA